jgi:hypothetical protein
MASNFSAPKGIAAPAAAPTWRALCQARVVLDWLSIGGPVGGQKAWAPLLPWPFSDCLFSLPRSGRTASLGHPHQIPHTQTYTYLCTYLPVPSTHTLIAIAREHFPWSRSSAVHSHSRPRTLVFPPACCNQTKKLHEAELHLHHISIQLNFITYLATRSLSHPGYSNPLSRRTSLPSLPTLSLLPASFLLYSALHTTYISTLSTYLLGLPCLPD